VGPWDPNWRPDPTGRRLQAMRATRRGALLAAVIFGFLVGVASVVGLSTAGSLLGPDVMAGAIVAGFSLPGVALLGAGLTSAARGTGASAVSAGLAIGVGVPVAAVTSGMIGVFVVAASFDGLGSAAAAAGAVLRQGVTAAERIWPLIVLGAAAWVVLVRRVTRPLPDVVLEPDGTDRQS
jgi:hypothetical protein